MLVWRHPGTGAWILVENLGWGERPAAENWASLPPDVAAAVPETARRRAEVVRRRSLARFARSGRLPGYREHLLKRLGIPG